MYKVLTKYIFSIFMNKMLYVLNDKKKHVFKKIKKKSKRF